MKIGRTVPPAAAPLGVNDLWHGLAGLTSSGRAIRGLEEEIRREFAVPHVFLVSSGTAALALTLEALKSLSPRRDVVIPAFTCFSVPAAVLHAGLRPAPCDIDARTFDFDDERLGAAVNGDTLCVVAHHLFGIASAMDRIRGRCSRAGAFVVEDAAQAMGVEANGRKLGTLGDVGIFSLGRGKNITCGSGGIIVTRSDRIAAAIGERYRQLPSPSRVDAVKDFVCALLLTIFIRPRLYWIPAALPFLKLGQTIFPKRIRVGRLSGMKAGMLRNWHRHLAQANQMRAAAATYFSQRLPLAPAAGPSYPYLRLPIVVSSAAARERLYAMSQARGLGVSVGYPTSIDKIPEVRARCADGALPTSFPTAQRVADNLLTLPTHHWLSDADKRAIADLCREVTAA